VASASVIGGIYSPKKRRRDIITISKKRIAAYGGVMSAKKCVGIRTNPEAGSRKAGGEVLSANSWRFIKLSRRNAASAEKAVCGEEKLCRREGRAASPQANMSILSRTQTI
jgi:hypothetical protein